MDGWCLFLGLTRNGGFSLLCPGSFFFKILLLVRDRDIFMTLGMDCSFLPVFISPSLPYFFLLLPLCFTPSLYQLPPYFIVVFLGVFLLLFFIPPLPGVYSTSLESWSICVWLEEIPFGECCLVGAVSEGWCNSCFRGLFLPKRVLIQYMWSYFAPQGLL